MSRSIVNGQQVIEVIAGDGMLWWIDGQWVAVDQDAPVPEAVLAEVFTRVEGEGPWRVDVGIAEGVTHRLLLRADGSTARPGELVRVETTQPRKVRLLPHLSRKGILIGVASLMAAGIAGGVVAYVSSAGSGAHAAPADSSRSVLWQGPAGAVPVGASGSLVAAVDSSQLVLLDGLTGTKLQDVKDAPVADASQVRIASSGNLTVVDTGADNGVLVLDGKASRYSDKGTLLARGPVPVIVGGKAGDRKNFVVKDGALVEVQAPARGNSLFGGLPGGGTVWAVSGGKVTYVPATGTQRTITLAPPVVGATVSSWVATAESRTAVIWKTGDSSVLAVHATGAGATGTIEYELKLKDGETALANAGRVLVGPGPVSITSPGAISTVISLDGEKVTSSTPACPSPLATAEQLWCAGEKGQWMAGDFSVPSEPITAGKGFVLLTEGEGFVAITGPNATTTK